MQIHTVQVSSSGFLCAIDGTYVAAISTIRFVDVVTLAIPRWVQLKADSTLTNGLCVCISVW